MWLDDWQERISLANEGEAIAVRLEAQTAKRSVQELTQTGAAWAERAKLIEWERAAQLATFEVHMTAMSMAIDLEMGAPEVHLHAMSRMVREDGHRFARGRNESERRLLVLLAVRSATGAPSEADLAEDLGIDGAESEALAEWAVEEGLLKVTGGTGLGGRSVKMTSRGRSWLEHEKLNIVSGPKARRTQASYSLDVDLSFLRDADQRAILDAMLMEMGAAVAASLPMASIVLAGAISEGILYDALVARKTRAVVSLKAPKVKGSKTEVKDIDSDAFEHEWTLRDLIDVARDIGLIGDNAGRMANDVLRDFRNMIHPKKQAKSGRRPREAEMKGCVAWLEALARDVAEAPL